MESYFSSSLMKLRGFDAGNCSLRKILFADAILDFTKEILYFLTEQELKKTTDKLIKSNSPCYQTP